MPNPLFSLIYGPLLALSMSVAPVAQQTQNRELTTAIDSAFVHPFHISVCLVEYNAPNKTLEISLQLFADDLDLVLTQVYGKRFFLGTRAERPETNETVKDYLQKNLQFSVNGTPMGFTFLGKEIQDEKNFELWCFLEIENVPSLSQFEFTNSLLVEKFNDQSNVVKLQANGRKESMLLSYWKRSGSFSF